MLAQPIEQSEPVEQQVVTEPSPEPKLVLRDLLVIQADRYGDTANDPNLVATTLFPPIQHKDRAKRVTQDGAYDYSPMPLGLMTFEGEIDEPIKLRLTLSAGRDAFHANWPADAIAGEKMLQWQDLSAADDSDRAAAIDQDDDWLAPLRSSEDRVWFQSRSGQFKERFLLYDPSFRYKPAVLVDLVGDAYSLKKAERGQADPPLTLLVRKSDAGWTADAVASPWPKPTSPIAQKTSDRSALPTLTDALAPVAELLTERGYNEQEIALALGMIASAGFESSTFSLIYIMPQAVIDEHIRLQIRPMPDEIVRTAIVVVNNADPELGSIVNALLDDLGSDHWLKRDRAQRALIERGQAAIKKVRQLTDHPDPEVAFRAQQILDAYEWKMDGNK